MSNDNLRDLTQKTSNISKPVISILHNKFEASSLTDIISTDTNTYTSSPNKQTQISNPYAREKKEPTIPPKKQNINLISPTLSRRPPTPLGKVKHFAPYQNPSISKTKQVAKQINKHNDNTLIEKPKLGFGNELDIGNGNKLFITHHLATANTQPKFTFCIKSTKIKDEKDQFFELSPNTEKAFIESCEEHEIATDNSLSKTFSKLAPSPNPTNEKIFIENKSTHNEDPSIVYESKNFECKIARPNEFNPASNYAIATNAIKALQEVPPDEPIPIASPNKSTPTEKIIKNHKNNNKSVEFNLNANTEHPFTNETPKSTTSTLSPEEQFKSLYKNEHILAEKEFIDLDHDSYNTVLEDELEEHNFKHTLKNHFQESVKQSKRNLWKQKRENLSHKKKPFHKDLNLVRPLYASQPSAIQEAIEDLTLSVLNLSQQYDKSLHSLRKWKVTEHLPDNPPSNASNDPNEEPFFLPKSFKAPGFKLTKSKNLSNNEEIKQMESALAEGLTNLQKQASSYSRKIAFLRTKNLANERMLMLVKKLLTIIRLLLTHLIDNENIICTSTKPKTLYAGCIAAYYFKHKIKNEFLKWLECSRETVVRTIFSLTVDDKTLINNYISNSLIGTEFNTAQIIIEVFLKQWFPHCTFYIHDHILSQEKRKQYNLNLRKELQRGQITTIHEKTAEAIENIPNVTPSDLKSLIHQETKSVILNMKRKNFHNQKQKNITKKQKYSKPTIRKSSLGTNGFLKRPSSTSTPSKKAQSRQQRGASGSQNMPTPIKSQHLKRKPYQKEREYIINQSKKYNNRHQKRTIQKQKQNNNQKVKVYFRNTISHSTNKKSRRNDHPGDRNYVRKSENIKNAKR